MSYTRAQMVKKDYKWSARADHDNPKFVGAQERSELNREEGYEMLSFINSLAKAWNLKDEVSYYQTLERIILTDVPSTIRTRSGIKEWIEEAIAKTNAKKK